MIKITVPATSANMGSGFDSMGVALRLYNEVSLAPSDHVDIHVHGGARVRRDASNLIYKTVSHVYDLCGKTLHGLKIIEKSNIPKTRGLGSSSACIVAGILGANELLGRPLSQREMIDLAAQLEGHPDNAVPAMIGGVVVSVLDGGHVYYTQLPLKERLLFTALIPDFQLNTGRARAALPEQVRHEDARFNVARAALLAASLSQGKLSNLKIAMQDRLHQDARFAMIPGGRELYDRLYEAGALGVYISGAGPTLIAVTRAGNRRFPDALRAQKSEALSGFHILPLHCDLRGATVTLKKHSGRS